MTDNPASNFKNNVTRLLDSRKVSYRVHLYDYDAGVRSAVEVADAIGLPPAQVFKTLVVLGDDPNRKPLLVVLPGPETLNMKALAQGARLKKARMSTHDEAERLTGLQTGGISALALINRGFDLFLDDRASRFDTIAVSAGERGANLELAVKDFIAITKARLIDLT